MSGIHADSARSLVRQLIDTGERLPKELRRDILHLGDAGVTALLEILEDETLAQIDSPRRRMGAHPRRRASWRLACRDGSGAHAACAHPDRSSRYPPRPDAFISGQKSARP